jgi:hypothetical protein
MVNKKLREAFSKAYYMDDTGVVNEMLMMFLGYALAGENIYIAGQDPQTH